MTHGKPLLRNKCIFSRIHGVLRKTLTHPADRMTNVEQLQPMRFTCSTLFNGEQFSVFDSWNMSHHNLKLPWTGTTILFGRLCNHVDAHIDRLYNLQSASLGVDMSQQQSVDMSANWDVDMSHTKSVRFDHSLDS